MYRSVIDVSKNRIAQLRNAHGISQTQLADIMKVGKQTIANWENHRREPTIESLYELSAYFNTSIDYIMCNKVDPMHGHNWNWTGDNGIGECKSGEYLCENIPHVSAIAKAMRNMTSEQRDTILNLCCIVYPTEFTEILRPRDNSKKADG
ncbi:hypothetical protein FACS1894217_13990 [Clostridia bacterium]|nr:hypothetical protein FACS1894217_13990 [Clostridia bacterium]